MQPASSYFSCPRCNTLQAVSPTLAGQAVTCPVCRAKFVLPHAAPPSPVAAPPLSPPTSAPLAAAPGPAHSSPPPARPAAPARAARGLWLEITFFGTFVTLFIVGLLVVLMIVGRKKLVNSGDDGADPLETVIDVPSRDEEPERPHWSDAKRFTLRKDAVKIKVREVAWAPVRTRDGARRVVVDEQRAFLAVYVSLRNARDAPRNYRSWYGSLFRVEGRQRSAVLYDDAGRSYPLHKFTSATDVQGHVPQATLLRPEETRDVIVFAVPDDVDRQSVEWLHLELPAAAYGSEGLLRFEIPADMIQGW